MYRYIQISTVYLYHKTSYDNATYYIGFAPLFTQGLKHGLIKYPAQAGLRAFSHFSLFPLPGLQQGSQTYQTASILLSMFHTFIYLQGSQTQIKQISTAAQLCTFIYLQGSQTKSRHTLAPLGALHLYLLTRFSNQLWKRHGSWQALHLYLLTRFSNICLASGCRCIALHLYLLTRFSN